MFKRSVIVLVRKNMVIGALIGLIVVFLGTGTLKLATVYTAGLKNKVIVIDPGHGGADPGAQNSGIKEKDINLDVSLRLRDVLEAKGCNVIMTREEDKDFFLPGFVKGRMAKRAELNQRIKLASANNADLFISIHANSFPRQNTYGMETYYHQKSGTGKELAELIQAQLAMLQADNKRKARAGDYYLINQTKMPAVIVEVGFISNPKERRLLSSETYRNKIASAIGTGIENYFKAFPFGVQNSASTVAPQETPPFITKGTFKLYFSNQTLENLVPEDHQINTAVWSKLNLSQKASYVLNKLIQGPRSNELTPTLAPVTKILSVTAQGGIATIDFNKSIQDSFSGGALEEDMAIKSILWSLSQIPGINGVRILINGEIGDSIGGHIILDRTYTLNSK